MAGASVMVNKLTVDGMSAMHHMLNQKLFGGELCKATFVVGRSCKVFGTFTGHPESKKWMAPGLRAILRPQITLSSCLCHTQEEAEQTMAHEMVHQWVHWRYGSRKKGEPIHGKRFMRKAAEINAVMGKDYVAAHGTGCVANDGKTRPVALIELADGRTIACSAERAFTDKARRHIKKVGDSMAGVVSVKRFRTRCPKATWLPSANRTKVKIRNRRISVPWPVIADELRDELLLMSVGKILETAR